MYSECNFVHQMQLVLFFEFSERSLPRINLIQNNSKTTINERENEEERINAYIHQIWLSISVSLGPLVPPTMMYPPDWWGKTIQWCYTTTVSVWRFPSSIYLESPKSATDVTVRTDALCLWHTFYFPVLINKNVWTFQITMDDSSFVKIIHPLKLKKSNESWSNTSTISWINRIRVFQGNGISVSEST